MNGSKRDLGKSEYIEILNKLIELENQKKKPKFTALKITACIVGGIGCVMFCAVLCYYIIVTGLSVESILSTLLAFFSIFISIFFYFKADEASTKFYKSSYDFMKEVSVTLGKIEERFGEKLNHLSDKLSHLDNVANENSVEIEDQKDDKNKLLEELIAKTNLSEEERNKYRQEINDKDQMIERLKNEQFRARREADILRRRIFDNSEIELRTEATPEILTRLLKNGISGVPTSIAYKLRRHGFVNASGEVNRERIINALEEFSNN